MSIDRILPVARVRPFSARSGERNGPGAELRLTFDGRVGDDALVLDADGGRIRLAGLGTLGRELRPGDALRVRVVGSGEQVELEINGFERRGGGAPAEDGERETPLERQPSMRVDQALLRRFAWRAPDGAALAAWWHSLLVDAEFATPAGGAPASSPPRLAHETTGDRPAPGRPPVAAPTLPAVAWPAIPVALHLVESADGFAPGSRPSRRRRGPRALRVECTLPDYGRLTLHVHGNASGIRLDFALEDPARIPRLRDALPAIAAAFTAAKLRLAGCRLACGTARHGVEPGHAPAGEEGSVPDPSVFRAAAEVVLALCPPVGISPATR